MSAAMALHVALSLRLDAIEAYRLAHAYRDEVLHSAAASAAEVHKQCHRTVCAGCEVRRDILDVLTGVTAASGEKASATAPEVTPQLTDRQTWLLAHIRTEGGRWKTGRARTAYALSHFGAVGVDRVRRDLQTLHACGHLHQVDEDGVRYYLLDDTR